MQLGEVAKAKPAVAIGSYPFFDPQHGPNTNVVPRARDAHMRSDNLDSVGKLYTEDNFRQLVVGHRGDASFFGGFGEFEDHGQRSLSREIRWSELCGGAPA